MSKEINKLNKEIEYLDSILDYLIKEELSNNNKDRQLRKEVTKKNLKKYLGDIEVDYQQKF